MICDFKTTEKIRLNEIESNKNAKEKLKTKIKKELLTRLKRELKIFQQEPGNTWAFVTSVGARFKLGQRSDIMLDARWQYYFSNWVDGLNPSFEANNIVEVPENLANDWIFWINLGYIYYLN